MNINLVTKEELSAFKAEIGNMLSEYEEQNQFEFISIDKFIEFTGFGKTTIHRLENVLGVIKSYKFPGSNRKFYKKSELIEILNNGQ